MIEKKNKFRLEREQVAGFEVDEANLAALLAESKPMAKPEGSGKKKRKNKTPAPSDIWLKKF